MKYVKIRLLTDRGIYMWLTIDFFRNKRRWTSGSVDSWYLTNKARFATPIPVEDARLWMREAKYIAGYDGIVVEKGEYILGGKPTTLKAAGLHKPVKSKLP